MISAAVRGHIAQRREIAGQVAVAAGISRAALYRKLDNESPWKAEEVDRLARYFGVTRDSLYEGRADFRDAQSNLGSEGWGFESLRVHPQRRRTDRRHLALVPIYADAAA